MNISHQLTSYFLSPSGKVLVGLMARLGVKMMSSPAGKIFCIYCVSAMASSSTVELHRNPHFFSK